MPKPFWQSLSLEEMNMEQWEAICDGCARCCVEKLEDADTGEVHYTNVACTLLDIETCRCRAYEERTRHVPECIPLSPQLVRTLPWLPVTCAYRRLAEGRGLAEWHPLVTGRDDSTLEAGISARGWLIAADEADDLEDHLVIWEDVD